MTTATATRTPKSNRFVKKNNNFDYDYDARIPDFTLYGGHKQTTANFLFLFLNLSAVAKKSTRQLYINSPTFDVFSELE